MLLGWSCSLPCCCSRSGRFTIGEKWKHTVIAFAVFPSTQDILRREMEGCSFDDSCGRLISGVDK
jgi:hypothetical protein